MAAVDHGVPVGFFSLEMSADQLVLAPHLCRAACGCAQCPHRPPPDSQWSQLSTRIGNSIPQKIFIDDTPALGILELRAKARPFRVEHNIGMIIVRLSSADAGAEEQPEPRTGNFDDFPIS